MSISRTSEIDFSLETDLQSFAVEAVPLADRAGDQMSARKSISRRLLPLPSQASHRPPSTLKLKRPGLYPRAFDSGSWV